MKFTNAFFFGITLVSTNAAVLHVDSKESKQYKTINDAVKAAAPGDTILVYPGTYKEKVTVDKDSITLKGTAYPSLNPSENLASIEASNFATQTDDDSATLYVSGSNVKIYNINITNSAVGDQAAVSIASTGQKNGFYTTGIIGTQGTLYVHQGTVFVGRSYIEGAVDVVYGRIGTGWFQGVEFGATGVKGTLTAQGRQMATDTGYFVFDKAKVILGKKAAAGTKGTVFLGRPWGDFARVVFQNSNLGGVISSAGWLLYTTGQNTRNLLLGEYSNTNTGGLDTRVSWAKLLSTGTDISVVLPDYKTWVDSAYLGLGSP